MELLRVTVVIVTASKTVTNIKFTFLLVPQTQGVVKAGHADTLDLCFSSTGSLSSPKPGQSHGARDNVAATPGITWTLARGQTSLPHLQNRGAGIFFATE
jgi:hypothetical protein